MAAFGFDRARRETISNRNSLEHVSPEVPARTGRPLAPRKRSAGRKGVGNVVVMTLAGGLVATMALPAYAFAPGSTETAFVPTASTELARTDAQTVSVNARSVALSVARDGFTATTKEELAARAAAEAAAKAAEEAAAAAAAAEARRQEVAEEMTSYAESYDGPSAAEYLESASYPEFDLGSVYGVASQYQGVPYVYGGATPAGFDCSGLVMYVYAQFGISLPHSSNAQGAAGTRISIEEAQPGDLVIMSGHDGFYAGNGNILHAPYEGTSVRVQPIWTSDYYIVRLGI